MDSKVDSPTENRPRNIANADLNRTDIFQEGYSVAQHKPQLEVQTNRPAESQLCHENGRYLAFPTNLAESYEKNSLETNRSKNRALSKEKEKKNRNRPLFSMVPSPTKDNEEDKRAFQGVVSTLCDSNFENHQTSPKLGGLRSNIRLGWQGSER